ncbi:hypothetical protein BGP_4123 [Beggiatoa sp. PS]|nr:hypothetical protein BGP_4123 [Beggiatoa sp. PS]
MQNSYTNSEIKPLLRNLYDFGFLQFKMNFKKELVLTPKSSENSKTR